MSKFTQITRDIADDEVFIHNGSVELHGNIGDRATIIINKGGLVVHGKRIGDDVNIKTTHKRKSILETALDVSKMTFYPQADIQIDSLVGKNFTVQTNGSLTLKKPCGLYLNATARGDFKAPYVDSFSTVNCGLNMKIDATGNCVNLTASDAVVNSLGHRSDLQAKDILVHEADSHCNIIGEFYASVGFMADDCYLKSPDMEIGKKNPPPFSQSRKASQNIANITTSNIPPNARR